MADYRYLITHLRSGTILDELPLGNVAWSHELNGDKTLEATIPRRHPKATRQNLAANRNGIYVERNRRIVWGGIIRNLRRETDSNSIGIRAAGFWSHFRKWVNRTTLGLGEYWDGATDQLEIAKQLVNWVQDQPGANIGIQTGPETSPRTREGVFWHHWERKNIGEAIEQLAARIDGFDFDIASAWNGEEIDNTLTLYYPRKGIRTNHAIEWGTNVLDYSWNEDGENQETIVDVLGAGEERDMLIATASDPNLWHEYPATVGVISHTDVSRIETLDDYAQRRLRRNRYPLQVASVTLEPRRPPTISTFHTGDEVRVRIRDGIVDYDRYQRIHAFKVSVGALETVELTFAEPALTQ